jgi:hypothetical protein
MTLFAVFLLIWGAFSILALALAKASAATEEEYADPGQPVTVWEIIRTRR